MRLTTRFAVISFFLLTIFSCNKNRVTITQFAPQGEVEELQSFTFEFSSDVAPANKLDEWVDEDYVTFEPPIQGRFKWLTTNTLLFSPDRALLPSQEYTAKVNSRGLLSGTNKSGKFDTYSFHTRFFEAEAVEFFWKQIPKADHRVSVQANLTFTYEVDPNELKNYLSISNGASEILDYTIETDQPAKVIALNFGEIAQTEKAQEFKVTIRAGLNSILNRSPLAEDRTFAHTLAGITRLAIISTTSGTDGESGWVEIHTTQAVDKDELSRYITVTPRPRGLNYAVSDNRIRIEGAMEAGTQVSVNIKEGLPGLYGGKLDESFQESIVLADLEPQIRFADRLGTYLVRGGMENIRVEATNVPAAQLEVYEVYKNNLLFFFYENWSYQSLYYDRYSDYYNNTQNYHVNYFGKKLYEEKLEFESFKNERQAKTINLNKVLDQRFKGVYVVQVNSEEDYWMRDAKLIAISDIGLIAKYSGSELLVFANSLSTANALAEVEIKLISENNQTLVTGKTDAEGIVRFSNLKKEAEGFNPRMITAELADDFNFIDLQATNIETSRFDVGGKIISEDSYDCFVYSDRNLYRPGETAYLSAILREPNLEVVTEIPVAIKIINPQGKTFSEYQKNVNGEGSFELSVDLPEFAQTGQYIAEFYTGSDELLASYRFNVEEFAPDKIRVELNKSKDEISLGEQIDIAIKAEYLFGAAAANHKYEMDISLSHRAYKSQNYPEFDFSNYSTENSYIENTFSEGNLDANGKASSQFMLPTDIKSGGYVEGRAFVSVFDVTGRTVNRMAGFKAFPKNYFIGIKEHGYYFGTNKNIRFDLIALNPKDEPINNFEAEVELIRYEWATVLERNTYNGRYSYRSVEKEIKEWKKPFKLSGSATAYNLTANRSGRYELRVYKKGSSDYIKKQFYAYSWGSATASSFEINKEGQVEIILDKETYAPGETAKALFVTPFSGKMLITLEQNKVIKHMYVEVTENSTEIPLELSEAHVPNVYVSATLFRPHQADDHVPFLVGHGYTSVVVANPDNKIAIEIEAPDKIKPRTTKYVTVKAEPEKDIFVTLAAVDEGVLQVKNFQSPDPYAHMYAKRGLGVQSHDLYEYLLPEIVSSSPAGGDEFGSADRLNPVRAKRFKLLAQWSGIRRTNSKGEVEVPIEIPQYNGEVRLMAVAYKGKRFGSASKAMKVADDIILMPAVPRFLSTNDSLAIPVTVMNTTGKAGEVKVHIGVEGPLNVGTGKFQSLELAANGSGQMNFVIRTGREIGNGKIVLSSSGMDKVIEEIEIAVRPISPLVIDSEGGSISAGSSRNIQIPNDFISSTQNTTISMSTFPAMEHAEYLRSLLGYPHGCLEQTISKLFPQLYFQELSSIVAPETFQRGNPAYYVKEGIHKLESMARYDGSFIYWPGGTDYNWWGTVYATHFLLEARSAGYVVNDNVLQSALKFLAQKASDKSTYDYVHFTAGSRKVSKIAHKEILYSLYVLALAGKPDIPLMNYYRGRPNLLANDTRYLLAGAFALAKNYNAYNDIIPAGYENERAERTTGGSFDSEARANAIMLNVLLDVDPSNKNIPSMLRHLAGMGNDIWSTQDRAWTFLALGKAASQQARSNVQLDIQVDGKTLATLNKSNPSFISKQLNGKSVTLKAKGEGDAFFLWQSEGIKSQGVAQEVDENMQVRRTYFDRNGEEITNYNFNQGDLVVCRISLTGGERSAENIAITDMIPAGFEIENPRLNASANLAWLEQVENTFYPEYLDVRDDRLLIFTNLERQKTKHFHYLLRVVNTGTFQLPAIGADAMYDPAYRSYHGGGLVRVR